MIKLFYLLAESTGSTSSHTNFTTHKQFSGVTYTVVILIWLVDKLGQACNTHLRKLESTFIINIIVAPCIFVESLQFINQRMHI